MKVSIDYSKSLEENAEDYFKKAKKYRKKLEGAKIALSHTKHKLNNLDKVIEKKEQRKKRQKPPRKKEWYEKYRWFFTSEDMLVIAGRDATTNEVVIKKYTQKGDLIFHTEMSGSPFGVLEASKKKPTKKSIEEAAQFIGCYSKAWKLGMTAMEVFYVSPDQVTKEAPSGEYIQKGSFMIYGRKKFVSVELKLFIGIMEDGKIMAGPLSAVEKHCKKHVALIQGNSKTSSLAKTIKKELGARDLDEIMRVIPPGSKLLK